MIPVIVAMGGNQGDVLGTFKRVMSLLSETTGVERVRLSRVFQSVPMGAAAGDMFLNAALAFDTSLAPESLLDRLQEIEQECGRVRTIHWGPRTLDLDLVAFGNDVINTPRLMVPHPHCWYRRFVLDPVCDVAADHRHAVVGLTFRELRDRLLIRPMKVALEGNDSTLLEVRRLTADFPNVTFTELLDTGRVAMTLRFDELDRAQCPFELRCADFNRATQFARDALTAATDELQAAATGT